MKTILHRWLGALLIVLIFAGGGANSPVKSEENAIPPTELEEDMALKDKLVNLEDLSVVGNVVGELKSASNLLKNVTNEEITLTWEQGGIATGGGNTNSNYRIRSLPMLIGEYASILATVADGYSANTYFYSAATPSASTLISRSGAYQGTKEVQIPAGTVCFRSLLLRGDGSSTDANLIIPADGANMEMQGVYPFAKKALQQSASPRSLIFVKDSAASSLLPPNSLYAIRACADADYDGIRFSTFVTTDGYLVAVHDVNINSLAVNPDGSAISTTVMTAESTLAQLNQYDWGLKFGENYRGLKVPMLDDCLKFAAEYNLSVAIDIKNPSSFTSEIVTALVSMLLKHGHDNAQFMRANSTQKTQLHAASRRFSFHAIGDKAYITENLSAFTALMTSDNHIYWSNTGDTDADAISLCYANGFEFTASATTAAELVTAMGNGARYIECEYLGNAKWAAKSYMDSMAQ